MYNTPIYAGNTHLYSNAILHQSSPIMVCLYRQREELYSRTEYTPGESGEPTPFTKVSSVEHPPASPTTDLTFREVSVTRVKPIETHTECKGLTVMVLSPDYMSVVEFVKMEVIISNGVLALHHFHPLFAISTEKGRKVLIYQISRNDDGTSSIVLVETLTGHNRKITAISFCKLPDTTIQIASGDDYGNVIVYRMDFEHPKSAKCVGILENTLPDYCIAPPYPQITSIDWSGNTILLSGYSTIWKIQSPVVFSPTETMWKITTPIIAKSPPDLEAVSFEVYNVKLCCMHPSQQFFVTVSSFGKFVYLIEVHDTSTFKTKFTFKSEPPLNVFSMQFSVDGSKLLLGCTKETIVLNVQPDGAAMTLFSRYDVGHTRNVSSVIIRQTEQGDVVLSTDLTGMLVRSKLV